METRSIEIKRDNVEKIKDTYTLISLNITDKLFNKIRKISYDNNMYRSLVINKILENALIDTNRGEEIIKDYLSKKK